MVSISSESKLNSVNDDDDDDNEDMRKSPLEDGIIQVWTFGGTFRTF